MTAIVKPLTREQMAEQIRWLEAENAKLRAAVEERKDEANWYQADARKLRAALEALLTAMGEGSSRGRAIDLVDRRYIDRARAALEETK